jgi:hypothetical protein
MKESYWWQWKQELKLLQKISDVGETVSVFFFF